MGYAHLQLIPFRESGVCEPVAGQAYEWNAGVCRGAPLVGAADLNCPWLGFRQWAFEQIGDKILWGHIDTYFAECVRLKVDVPTQ
jgi:hypothetical protein